MKIEVLHPSRLDETRRVVAELFPWEDEHQVAVTAALSPERHAAFLAEKNLERARFWTAIFDGSVVGIAALYDYRSMPTETWLSWFGLLPVMRGHGNGARFLDAIIQVARSENRGVLRLWTTDEEEYRTAFRMYEKRGFVAEDCPALPNEDWRTVVMSLGLNGATPIPWFSVTDRPVLCGRVAPTAAAAMVA
jgi:GNAT superfamily N-acetyltransferase